MASPKTARYTLKNESCGDEITVFFKMRQGKIVDGSWTGKGCAIAQASADLMMGALIGTELADSMFWTMMIDTLLMKGKVPKEFREEVGDLQAMGEVARMPARVKCAETPWQGAVYLARDERVQPSERVVKLLGLPPMPW